MDCSADIGRARVKPASIGWAASLVCALMLQAAGHASAQTTAIGLRQGGACRSNADCEPGLVCEGLAQGRFCENHKCVSDADCVSQAFCGIEGAYGQICVTNPDYPLSKSGERGSRCGVFGYSVKSVGGGAHLSVPFSYRVPTPDFSGTCVTIKEASSGRVVAIGTCNPEGRFRVGLEPGRYQVDGRGGSQQVEVKPGQWQFLSLSFFVPTP